MKTLLVPVDLSATSVNAAHVAFKLAGQLNTNVKLCHALNIPAVPLAAADGWAYDDYSFMEDTIKDELNSLAKRLIETKSSERGECEVEVFCQMGSLANVIDDISDREDISMLVLGMAQPGIAERMIFGSASREIIDNVSCPVLLIPPAYQFAPVKRIAFATDLNHGDIAVIGALCLFADKLGAEVLIVHIADGTSGTQANHRSDEFLTEVACKCRHTKVEYRTIASAAVESGLDWLTEHGRVDMLVMVHHWQHFFSRLISGSHTKKMATHIHIPLLVYSGEDRPSSLPSF